LAAAHLSGWAVRKMPLVVPQEPVITDDGVTTPAPLPVADHFATVRKNPITGNIDVLGVVGSKYEPVQNEESCALLNALTDESGAVFESLLSARRGRRSPICAGDEVANAFATLLCYGAFRAWPASRSASHRAHKRLRQAKSVSPRPTATETRQRRDATRRARP
jgi:hypothetical protein